MGSDGGIIALLLKFFGVSNERNGIENSCREEQYVTVFGYNTYC